MVCSSNQEFLAKTNQIRSIKNAKCLQKALFHFHFFSFLFKVENFSCPKTVKNRVSDKKKMNLQKNSQYRDICIKWKITIVSKEIEHQNRNRNTKKDFKLERIIISKKFSSKTVLLKIVSSKKLFHQILNYTRKAGWTWERDNLI